MNFRKYIIPVGVALSLCATSCVDDLNVDPENPTTKTELTSKEDYLGLVARAYGGLVFGGGVQVNDEGRAIYTRLVWNLQELNSDEVVMGDNWKDAGIPEVKKAIAGPDCRMLYEAYSRFNYQIALCNAVLKVIDHATEYGVTDEEIAQFKSEMRTLRALSYYHIIDIFGKGPWITENHVIGDIPPTYTREQLFEAVTADLSDAINGLLPARQQIYGRISKEAGQMLLAKLYLNAEVYTGKGMWQEAANLCQQIQQSIPWDASLDYRYLFCATNDKYVGNGEIIWAVPQDANTMQTYGGTTYLSVGAYNAKVDCLPYGCAGDQWAGPRVNPTLSRTLTSSDKRRLFYTGKLHEDILPADMQDWTEDGGGYMCVKYVYTPENDYTNASGKYTAVSAYNNADYPLFRLADVYLMLAECEKHGASGCNGVDRFNDVRLRAGGAPVGSYSLDDVLKERMCELYWEGHRRSDLIRFGKYTGSNYMWSWKGGSYAGAAIADYRSVYAIPVAFEETLGQNPGYPTGLSFTVEE
ncbi:MAG: RagB/SusD family nutrient uptake outer membrane protein [Muribaculaceae bacterium]|nr:RagB/SusD family nutrient uptake outer membrane protein [Muribaculaceae bacterium]